MSTSNRQRHKKKLDTDSVHIISMSWFLAKSFDLVYLLSVYTHVSKCKEFHILPRYAN